MPSALARTIAEQPAALERVLALDLGPASARLAVARRIWLVGTGTSQHAAELGALMLRETGRETAWWSSAAFARRTPALDAETTVIVISHTTQTSFARAARAAVLASSAQLVTITGAGGQWPEAVQAAAAETSETYTVSYTCTLAVLARLSVELGSPELTAAHLIALPARAQAAIDAESGVPIPARGLVIAGSGPGAITAREGALKLREAARVLSEGYEAEYLLHGGAVPLTGDDGLLLLDPAADPDGLLSALGEAAAAAGVRVSRIAEPEGLPAVLAQIALTIRLQALAERAAQARGQDPDVVIVGPWAADRLWELGGPERR